MVGLKVPAMPIAEDLFSRKDKLDETKANLIVEAEKSKDDVLLTLGDGKTNNYSVNI